MLRGTHRDTEVYLAGCNEFRGRFLDLHEDNITNEAILFSVRSSLCVKERFRGIHSFLPQVVQAGGFTTQLVLYSSDGTATSGSLRFFSQFGMPLNLPLH